VQKGQRGRWCMTEKEKWKPTGIDAILYIYALSLAHETSNKKRKDKLRNQDIEISNQTLRRPS
jgi:hypothetical protein